MALKRREKILAVVTGVLGVVVLGYLLLGLFGGETTKLRAIRKTLSEDNAKKRDQVAKSREAQLKLVEWRKRSLPTDPAAAGSLYQNWLLELSDRVKLRGAKIKASEVRPLMGSDRRPIYHRLSFTVGGQATLEQLTQWLHEFYRTGHLHKIASLSMKPIEGSKNLELAISIEALALPESGRTKELTKEASMRLAAAESDKYRAAIVERDLFAPYSPPRPAEPKREEPPPPPPFDPRRYTFLTAIVEVDGKPQVWIEVRTTGEKFRLREGDSFQIGPLRGTILHIDRRHVQSEVDGKRYLLALGESFHEAIEVP